MAVQHLILGWIKKHPSHGYVIKQCYETFINPSEKLNDATLYPLLRDMDAEGLITRDTENREAGPSRKVVSITPKGEREFDAWLRSDSNEGLTRRFRYEFFRTFPFLTKYTYFHELDDATALAKVRRQLESRRERLADYRHARESMIAKGLEECKVQVIDFGIMQEETTVRWLEEMEAYYEARGGNGGKRAGKKASAGKARKPAKR